jgi:SAM-dependent methyltransferase
MISGRAAAPDNSGTAGNRTGGVDLVIVSFLLLFLELAVIRWLPATIRVVAYFSNVVLVSCFLGMGLGCLLRTRRDLLTTVAPLLLVFVAIAQPLGRAGVANPFQSHEFIFGVSGRLNWLWVLPLVFTLNALVFVGIGQRLARGLDALRPLVGYSLNVVGSLAGSVAFALVAVLRLPPAVWFGIAAAALLWLVRNDFRVLVASAASVALMLVMVARSDRDLLWSPYYQIGLHTLSRDEGGGVLLTVNNDTHQEVLDLSDAAAASSGVLRAWQDSYDFPYRFVRPTSECRILVLGAGTGNDVAAALRETPCSVDAVELDPVIADLGRRLHPERPYDSGRVRLVIDDARAFLSSARGPYQRIVLGWLDSHRLFSSLSNVRQDNSVYTREAMRLAGGLLADDGALVLSFYVGKPWVGEKLYWMLYEAFGQRPAVFAQRIGGYGLSGQIFVAGPAATALVSADVPGFANLQGEFVGLPHAATPTDDWPYLYYRDRRLSGEYVATLTLLMAIASALVLPLRGKAELSKREAGHFFVLGAGFLLLEVRNITALALVFGSTWLVSSIVISAVLLMILAANALVAWGVARSAPTLLWLLLFVSVLLALAGSRIGASGLGHTGKALLATGAVSLSFLVAGLLFARSFAGTRSPGAALGFNVLGAVVGGLAEYLTVLVGLDGIAAVAMLLYLLAWATAPRALAARVAGT